MKSRVFVDTSCYVANPNPSDAHTQQAVHWTERDNVVKVTPMLVLVEVANFFGSTPTRSRIRGAFEELFFASGTRALPAGDALSREGLSLYHDRADTSWSLTDCPSFEVTRRLRLTRALTADHHFE